MDTDESSNGSQTDPTLAFITQAHNDLVYDPDAQARVYQLCGFTEDAIYRLKLGWHNEHVVIPVPTTSGTYAGWNLYEPDPKRRSSANPKLKGAPGMTRDLYPPPEFYPPGSHILLTEGEPDTIVATGLGFAACGIPGTSGWKPAYAQRFEEAASVTVVTDSDAVGRKSAAKVIADLVGLLDGLNIPVRLLDLAPGDDDGYDLKDEVQRMRRDGMTDDDIRAFLQTVIDRIEPANAAPTGTAAPGDWPFLAWDDLPDEPPDPPEIIGLFYRRAVNVVHSEPGLGKSILAHYAAQCEVNAGGCVLWIDYEQGPSWVRFRMQQLGMQPGIRRFWHVAYPGRVPAPGSDEHASWLARIGDIAPTLVIIDAMSGSLHANSWSENSNDDIAAWEQYIALPLVRMGCAVLVLDHVTKDPDQRGRWAIGGQRKLGMVTGAAYELTQLEPFAIGTPGRMQLVTSKDRGGYRAPGTSAARVEINGTADTIEITIDTTTTTLDPKRGAGDRPAFRPTVLMERVSRYIELTPGCTKGDLENNITGKASGVRVAADRLTEEGYVEQRPDGPAQRHYSIRPYREAEDPQSDKYIADGAGDDAPATDRPDWLGDDFD